MTSTHFKFDGPATMVPNKRTQPPSGTLRLPCRATVAVPWPTGPGPNASNGSFPLETNGAVAESRWLSNRRVSATSWEKAVGHFDVTQDSSLFWTRKDLPYTDMIAKCCKITCAVVASRHGHFGILTFRIPCPCFLYYGTAPRALRCAVQCKVARALGPLVQTWQRWSRKLFTLDGTSVAEATLRQSGHVIDLISRPFKSFRLKWEMLFCESVKPPSASPNVWHQVNAPNPIRLASPHWKTTCLKEVQRSGTSKRSFSKTLKPPGVQWADQLLHVSLWLPHVWLGPAMIFSFLLAWLPVPHWRICAAAPATKRSWFASPRFIDSCTIQEIHKQFSTSAASDADRFRNKQFRYHIWIYMINTLHMMWKITFLLRKASSFKSNANCSLMRLHKFSLTIEFQMVPAEQQVLRKGLVKSIEAAESQGLLGHHSQRLVARQLPSQRTRSPFRKWKNSWLKIQ